MARALLPRRLLSLAAGLMIGAAGMFVNTTAAAAAQPETHSPTFDEEEFLFVPVCDGTNVLLIGWPDTTWSVEADGQQLWPTGGESGEVPLGGLETLFVPVESGEIVVTATLSQGPTMTWRYTWEEADVLCDRIPAPALAEASCEVPNTVSIPAPDETDFLLDLLPELPAAGLNAVEGLTLADFISYRLDGKPVALGSTHELRRGSHTVSLHLVAPLSELSQDDPLPELPLTDLDFRLHSWTIEVPGADCSGGGGGGLPITGTTITLVAGGAVLLLGLGTGVYLIARRRRVTFTA